MRIKRVHADDMHAALEQVRAELGEDAVIVSTRQLGTTPEERRRGLRGVEVVAGLDEQPASAVAQANAVAGRAMARAGLAVASPESAGTMSAPGFAGQARPVAGLPLSSVSLSAPRFPRVSRTGDDTPDLDGLVPAFEALAARSGRTLPAAVTPPPGAPVVGDGDVPPSLRRAMVAAGLDIPVPAPATRPSLLDDDHDEGLSMSFARALLAARAGESAPAEEESRVQTVPGARRDIAVAFERVMRSPSGEPIRRPVEPEPAPLRDTRRDALRGAVAQPVLQAADTAPARVATPAPLRGAGDPHAAVERAFETLRAAGLHDGVAESALEEAIGMIPPAALTDADRVAEVAISRLVARLPRDTELSGAALAERVVAFAGQAGVGKTSTLLMAAVQLHRAGTRVALVAADVSRTGSVEGLRRYGEMLGIPVEVAYAPEGLAAALDAAYIPGGVVLVDTPALTPGARSGEELTALRAAAPDAMIVLTVAATAGERELVRLARTARALGADAAAVTKLDEAESPGEALNALAALGLPLLLTARGRDLLADVGPASAMDLAVAALELATERVEVAA